MHLFFSFPQVVYFRDTWRTSQPKLKKTQENPSRKKFLIFPKMELSCYIITKISHIFSKESLSYISGNRTLHFSAQALKIKKSTRRKLLILQKTVTPKNFLDFLKERCSLCFGKLLIFQEVTFRPQNSKKFYTFPYKEAKFSKL